MRRGLVRIASIAAVLVGVLWWLDWSPLYFVVMPFVYREATLPPSQMVTNISYDPSAPADEKRQLDLFLPAARGFSTVVFVHGGGWTSGDRALSVGGADVYRNVGRFLATRGFATAVISYRLLYDVDWRGQATDVARAVAFVQQSIEARGASSRSVFLMGHSAGAQLATHVALEPEWLTSVHGDPTAICGVIAVSGAAYDMSDEDTYNLGADRKYYAARWGNGALDGTWRRDASPASHITTMAPPFLVLYADGDDPPLRHQASLLASRLLQADVPAREVMVPGSTHERMVVQLSRDDQTAGPATLNFLQSTTCPRAAPLQ